MQKQTNVEKAPKINDAWKNADLTQWCKKDLTAAISFLMLVNDNPEILRLVVNALEEWRVKMIENEKLLTNKPQA